MRKKIIKIVLIAVVLLILISVGNFLVNKSKQKSEITEQESEISEWSEYYQKIAEEKCKKNSYYSECCMSGLRNMVESDYLLADENENCLEGFKANMLLCIDTLIWCGPIK